MRVRSFLVKPLFPNEISEKNMFCWIDIHWLWLIRFHSLGALCDLSSKQSGHQIRLNDSLLIVHSSQTTEVLLRRWTDMPRQPFVGPSRELFAIALLLKAIIAIIKNKIKKKRKRKRENGADSRLEMTSTYRFKKKKLLSQPKHWSEEKK